MIVDLSGIKSMVDRDRAMFQAHLDHADPDLLAKQAEGLTAYGKRLDEWMVFLEKWVPQQEALDTAWSNVPPLAVEYLADMARLTGIIKREGNTDG